MTRHDNTIVRGSWDPVSTSTGHVRR